MYLRDLFKSLVLCVQKEQTGSVMLCSIAYRVVFIHSTMFYAIWLWQLSMYVEYTDGTMATGNGPLTMTEVFTCGYGNSPLTVSMIEFTGVTMATVHSL